MKKILLPSLLSLGLLTSSQAATLILGDGLESTGQNPANNLFDGNAAFGPGSVTLPGRTNVANSIANGADGTLNRSNLIQIIEIVDSSGNQIPSSTSNPLTIGGTSDFRAHSTFNLSELVIPPGEEITNISLFLEASDAGPVNSFTSGSISFFQGDFTATAAGVPALPNSALIGSRIVSATDSLDAGNFYEFDLSAADIDLSVNPTFEFTIASDTGEQFFFGADVGEDGTVTGTSITSTGASPFLEITTAPVPEPSASLLFTASALLMCGRRKRKNA